VIAVGKRMPEWVDVAFAEYARRLPRGCSLELVEVAAARRGRSRSKVQLLAEEAEQLLGAVSPTESLVALDERGTHYSTLELSQQLAGWLQDGRDRALLIGGADGLAPEVDSRASSRWSLSRLTLAHPLARVVAAEQLYRAWSLLNNLPYHRGE